MDCVTKFMIIFPHQTTSPIRHATGKDLVLSQICIHGVILLRNDSAVESPPMELRLIHYQVQQPGDKYAGRVYQNRLQKNLLVPSQDSPVMITSGDFDFVLGTSNFFLKPVLMLLLPNMLFS